MENNINFFENGRKTKFILNERQSQSHLNLGYNVSMEDNLHLLKMKDELTWRKLTGNLKCVSAQPSLTQNNCT